MAEAARLGRPTDCLEVGCGQLWVLRFLYKGIVCRKEDQIRSYHGVDIDPMVLDDIWGEKARDVRDAAWFQLFNGTLTIQDLTVEPTLPYSNADDGLYDVAWTTEVIEHMKPEFIEPWLASMAARLRPGAFAYVSTPNSDGSREKLPADHVREWPFDELKTLLEKYFDLVRVDGIFTQQPKFDKAFRAGPGRFGYSYRKPEERVGFERFVNLIKARFDPHFQRVILAAFYPEVANNCAWTLRKR